MAWTITSLLELSKTVENIKKAAQLIARGMWKRKPESDGSDFSKFERFDSRMYGAAGIETLRDRKIARRIG